MSTPADKLAPRWCWNQIKTAILTIPIQQFSAALQYGLSEKDGYEHARAQMAEDIRKKLVQIDQEASEHS